MDYYSQFIKENKEKEKENISRYKEEYTKLRELIEKEFKIVYEDEKLNRGFCHYSYYANSSNPVLIVEKEKENTKITVYPTLEDVYLLIFSLKKLKENLKQMKSEEEITEIINKIKEGVPVYETIEKNILKKIYNNCFVELTEPTTEFPDEYYYFGATYDALKKPELGFDYDIEGEQDWVWVEETENEIDEESEEKPHFSTVNAVIKYILKQIEEGNSL